MIGLLLKDFYTLRQYLKTMAFMFVFFALISSGLDNPAAFFEGFIILMSMMMTITTFSYDALAKWDRYALSMPVTRKEIVAAKYLISVILGLGGAIIAFLISLAVLKFKPVEGFGLTEHLYSTLGIIGIALCFSAILLPLIFKFGVEKCRFLLMAIFAVPAAVMVALSKMGVSMPSESSLIAFIKLFPVLVILFYLLSFSISVRIFSAKEM